MTSTKVKICGLSDAPTMAAALDSGADYVGLVFYGPSPRNVTLDQAATLAAMARGRAKIVALFVDPDDDQLRATIASIKPDILQLHGSETPARATAIADTFALKVMKAIKVKTPADARQALDYGAHGSLILFDAKPATTIPPTDTSAGPDGSGGPDGLAAPAAPGELPGGNGMAFDWGALDDVKSKVAFMLSGGLNPDNIDQAIAATGAVAVDVSSGVESAPGKKDTALIKTFITRARTAGQSSRNGTALAFDP